MKKLLFIIILFHLTNQLSAQPSGICGNDSRTRTIQNAVGRIVVYSNDDINQTNPIGVGTGFIIKNGYLVSAAHIFYDYPPSQYYYIIEFNVPSSSSTIWGLQGINKSAPERRYEIIKDSVLKFGQGVGNDLALFKVYPNEETGLYPIDPNAQGTYLELNTTTPAPSGLYKVYGYGRDDRNRQDSYTLQVATDQGIGYNPPPLVNGISETPFLEFKTDILNGCSGGPIIFSQSGHPLNNKVIGVVWGVQSDCKNQGTQTTKQAFAFYAEQPKDYANVRVEQVLNGGLNGTIGRWWKNKFINFSRYADFAFKVGSTQVLKASDTILYNSRYHKWNVDNDVANHKYFYIDNKDDKLFRSEFKEFKTNCFIKTYAQEANLNFGGLKLKDPWLKKEEPTYLDGTKGYRNLGSSAIWENIPDNFNPNYNSQNTLESIYKGVFLNQGLDWQPPYYSLKTDISQQNITLGQTGKTHKFYFSHWSGNPHGSAEFQYPQNLQTPVVFKQENATVQANYKGTQISSTIDGFKNNGQRKFIITSYPQAYYHLVYTSMGGIWYEKALVNYDVLSPVDWQLMNNQKALNILPNQEAKSPSIDYVYATQNQNEENYFIYIVYQNKKQDGKYEIRLAKFNQGGTKLFDISVYQSSTIDYNSIDCTPVVAVSKQVTESYPIKLIILWKRPAEGTASAGLYYLAGFDRGNYIEWTDSYPNPTKIPTTDVNSLNPTISAFKKPNEAIYYHLAYQQGNSDIKYSYVAFGEDGTTAQNPITVSGGSGSYTNISPSITVGNTSSGSFKDYDSPKIVWNADGAIIYRYRTNMTTTKWSPMYMYIENDEAQSPSISGPKYHPNGFDDEYYFGWSWLEGYYKSYVSTENLSQKRQMAYRGKDLQIATVGGGWEGFGYVVLDNFTRTTAPIVFENKWIDAQLGKITSNISAGRSGTVIKNNAEFYFAFGDIKLNDNTINFNQLNDTTVIESIDDLNESLKSEPIAITDNDILTYSVFYGLKDSAAAFNNLTNEDYIRFTVEIIDVNTQQVLSSLDDVEQRKQSLIEYENLSYQISMQGIGQREIILRLKVQTNLNTDCELANIYSFNQAVSKGRIKQMKWNEENLPKEFALEQNYPNPFNPTTVISWQSPVGGHQTLKIYDILGNEVATLIDEYREAGRYKLEYDASNLASGVYIYKLTAGSFVSSKKMMVIK
jgi:hypothetical protein